MTSTKPSDELLWLFEHTEGYSMKVPVPIIKGVLRELGKLPKKTVTKTGYHVCSEFNNLWVFDTPEEAYKNSHSLIGQRLYTVTWQEEVE